MRERPYHRLRHRHHQQQLFGGALWRDLAGGRNGDGDRGWYFHRRICRMEELKGRP